MSKKKLGEISATIFISYRFLYGLRSLTPLVITKTQTFLFYSALSTMIWAATYCCVGYLFGEFIKSELDHIEHIEKYIIGFIVLIGIFLIFVNMLKKRKKNLDNPF